MMLVVEVPFLLCYIFQSMLVLQLRESLVQYKLKIYSKEQQLKIYSKEQRTIDETQVSNGLFRQPSASTSIRYVRSGVERDFVY